VSRTDVTILRGRYRGRAGWIAGNLEDRAARGITRAIVHAGADVELLLTANLRADDQPGLFPLHEQDQPDRPPNPDRHGDRRHRRARAGDRSALSTNENAAGGKPAARNSMVMKNP